MKPGTANLDLRESFEKSFADGGHGLGTGFWAFDGRATRSEYWSIIIPCFLLSMFVGLPMILVPIIGAMVDGTGTIVGGGVFIFIGVVLMILCVIAQWPVTVRRLHDRDMSGWWFLGFWLLGIIPYVGWMASIVFFVIVGCLDGTPGQNQYGPDPKGRDQAQAFNRQCRPSVGGVNNIVNVNTASSPSTEDRLQKLAKLKARGLISEAEYAEKRLQILSEL